MKRFISMLAIFSAVCATSLNGCKDGSSSPDTDADAHVHADGSEHAPHGDHAEGPHGGTVADWGGGKYHVEFTVDHDKQEGTVYILAADEKTPAPIDAAEIAMSITDPPMQVTLSAVAQENDPPGTASRFVGNHEQLGVVQEYAGTISGVVAGTPYAGDFAEQPHGDHDHEH